MTQQLVRDVLLLDGSTLRLRTPEPGDYDAIKAFYDGLSLESLFLRFHGLFNTGLAARVYAEAEGVDRVALIGHHAGRVVAAASYEVLREPGVAEVAFAVAEDIRGRGIATRMLEQLAEVAAHRGIRRFDAWVMGDNRPMLKVFERAGFAIRRRGVGGEFTVSLDIGPTEASRERIDERDHIGAVASCRPIFSPVSVAVVGASGAPGDVGGEVVANILAAGFRGAVIPVNRAGEAVASIPATHSLSELEHPPELVIVGVGLEQLTDVAAEAAQVGAKALLVLTADASDPSPDAEARRERLLEIVREGGLRLLGPGSLGVVNTDPAVGLDATFAGAAVSAGQLAICSQSGAIGIGLLGQAAARGLGVSSFASLGDRIDVSTNDLLELWEEDSRTAAVVLYVESFGNPEHFARIAQRVSRRKPILAVKGRRALKPTLLEARSHTAAALHGDAVVDAMFSHAGVIRVRSGEELFKAAEFFESQPLPLGRRIAVLSNSDGLATLAADACVARELVVGEVRIDAPNPLVLGPGAGTDEYAAALTEALDDHGVDAAIVYYVDRHGGSPDSVLAAISSAASQHAKPVVASIIGPDGRLAAAPEARIPNFLFPEECAGVLARAAQRREWLSRPLGVRPAYEDLDAATARETIAKSLERAGPGGAWLTQDEGEALLRSHGIAVVRAEPCANLDTALAVAHELGGPIALKAKFPPPAAATDVDALLLGVQGDAAVRAGWHELERRVRLAGRRWTGVSVMPLVDPGADVLVGAIGDRDLGPVMALGLGGRKAGLGATAAFRPLPATDVEADELIEASSSVVILLDGFRGSAALDREGLRELLLRFASLLRECPEVVEADLNPVRCMPHSCVVLDARMRVESRSDPARVKTW